MVTQRFVVISITACAAEHAWPRVLVSRLSLSSLLQMQQRVLAPLYIWWWWLPQRIFASLKRSGWGIWSGTTNLDAGRGGVRAAARELLERLFAAWWWWPVAPLVSWWKRSFWSGRNNIRANNAGVPWPTPRRRRQQPWPGAAMHLKRRRRPMAGAHHFDRASRSTL